MYLKLFSCELLLENVFANSSNNDNNSISNKTNSSTSAKNGASNNSSSSSNNTNTKNTNGYNTNLSSLVFPDDFASLADFYGENVRLARIIEDIVSDNYIG